MLIVAPLPLNVTPLIVVAFVHCAICPTVGVPLICAPVVGVVHVGLALDP